MAFFQKNPVFKNNSKFLIIVRKYGTSNVPNEFLKKSLSLVRCGTVRVLRKFERITVHKFHIHISTFILYKRILTFQAISFKSKI